MLMGICALYHCENNGYVKQWKCVPLYQKGPHPILTWKEMHASEAKVSLVHNQFFDVVGEGIYDLINWTIID
jgi:hypothetical protein